MIIAAEDGSLLTPEGKVVFFSCLRFARDIGRGDHCFVCGASPHDAPFNDEHVLPQWLLRTFDLHEQRITLSNETTLKYGQFVVPCCEACNQELGRLVEEPVRDLLLAGYDAVCRHLVADGPQLLFTWLSLVYLKTHLKDRALRVHRDQRKGQERIGDAYDWGALHHVHCVARSKMSGCTIDGSAIGSLRIVPVDVGPNRHSFSFLDLYESRTIMIQINDCALIAVLDDACGVTSAFRNSRLGQVTRHLSPLEVHEVAAHYAYANESMKTRPRLYTDFTDVTPVIRADVPRRPEFGAHDLFRWGFLLHHCTKHLLDDLNADNVDEVCKLVRAGRWTFITELGDTTTRLA